jgi:hypothetical protein
MYKFKTNCKRIGTDLGQNRPMPLTSRPSPHRNRSPPNHPSSFFFLSLTSRARTSAKQSPTTSSLLPFASSRTAPTGLRHGRARGWDGRAPSWHACRVRVRAREPPRGNLLGGNTPIAPAGDTAGVVAAIWGRPHCQARSGVQSWSTEALCP